MLNSFDFVNIILVSVTSSFGHCIGMCGGFVFAYNAKLTDAKFRTKIIYISTYHAFRVLAYVMLGTICGAFGAVAVFSLQSRAYIYFIIGMMLVFLGFSLLKRGKILAILENDMIFNKFIAPNIKNAMKFRNFKSFAILGFLNGLIPCGIVYFFVAMTISSANAFYGALIMLIFGVCTIPTMFAFSYIANYLNDIFKRYMLYLSAVIITIYGLRLAYIGYVAII